MAILKDTYEISFWKDIEINGSYDEQKIAVIGSNTMTSQNRALEPNFVQNVNGTNKLTFKMNYQYIDNITGEKVNNPFTKQLLNEQKIKIFWKDKWYDLLIKNCQEDSKNKTITYTCEDLFITELSRTGFNLEFDTELSNNMGTVTELGEKIVENTDWKIIDSNNEVINVQTNEVIPNIVQNELINYKSDLIQQEIEEAVYEVTAINSFTMFDPDNSNSITIPSGSNILVFFSCIQNQDPYLQLIYASSYETEDSSMTVINGKCYWRENVAYTVENDIITVLSTIEIDGLCPRLFEIAANQQVSSSYRGKRLVHSEKTDFNSLLEKTVQKYSGGNDYPEIWGYEETKSISSDMIVNLFTNSSNMLNTSGWSGDNIGWINYPQFDGNNIVNYTSKGYLYFPGAGYYRNSGLQDNISYLSNGLTIGKKYVFRYRARYNQDGAPSPNTSVAADSILPYIRACFPLSNNTLGYGYVSFGTPTSVYVKTKDTTCDANKIYYSYNNGYSVVNSPIDENIENYYENWKECTGTCYRQANKDLIVNGGNNSLLNPYEIQLGIQVVRSCWLEDIELFEEAFGLDSSGNTIRIEPGNLTTTSLLRTEYSFYIDSDNVNATSIDDFNFLYKGFGDNSNNSPTSITFLDENDSTITINLSKVYNDNYEKVRSISEKQSNRFNLLQTLAETFECWVRFHLFHDNTGKLIKDANGYAQKYISFVKNIGKNTGLGFIYGIDLDSIKRTIRSDKIATKVIVSNSNNEVGENGFCSIARSNQNYPRTNYIYNFDYYINKGLIDRNNLNNDLYNSSTGYLTILHNNNVAYDEYTEKLITLNNDYTHQDSLYTTYNEYLQTSKEELTQIRSDIMYLAGIVKYDGQWFSNKDDTYTVNRYYGSLIGVKSPTQSNLNKYYFIGDAGTYKMARNTTYNPYKYYVRVVLNRDNISEGSAVYSYMNGQYYSTIFRSSKKGTFYNFIGATFDTGTYVLNSTSYFNKLYYYQLENGNFKSCDTNLPYCPFKYFTFKEETSPTEANLNQYFYWDSGSSQFMSAKNTTWDVNIQYYNYDKIPPRVSGTSQGILDIDTGRIGNYPGHIKLYYTFKDETAEQAIERAKLNTAVNNSDEFLTLIASEQKLINSISKYEVLLGEISIIRNSLAAQIDNYTTLQNNCLSAINTADLAFYKKYFRFIQEGTWNSDKYYDDTLYYLDALSVAYTSARPQISYDISVLRLSALDEFKNKIFNLGDIGYIQDTDFFGYNDDNITPYKEQILISEITSNFDNPEKNQIKIQNYKTQFEDLFQRITATVQSLQFVSGEYAKVSKIVDSNGTIASNILQESININSDLVFKAQNESVIYDNTGITVSDINNPNQKTKITSAGIIFTTDGINWRTGIDGNGVRTDALTTGTINTNNINIYSGTYPTFRWGTEGINAYSWNDNGVNKNKFIRFDQYGIYGANGIDSSFIPTDESDIWENSLIRFGLTWNGFFLRNDDGSVEINSTDDIVIKDLNNIQRIKMGRIVSDNAYELVTYNAAEINNLYIKTDDNIYIKLTDLIDNSNNLIGIQGTTGFSYLYHLDENNNYIINYNTADFSNFSNYYIKIGNEYINLTSFSSAENLYINFYKKTTYLYSLCFKNEDGNTVLETKSDGSLWVQDCINIQASEAQSIKIGYLTDTKDTIHGNSIDFSNVESSNIHEVINANNNFIVYEDGSLKATDGYFSGTITASNISLDTTVGEDNLPISSLGNNLEIISATEEDDFTFYMTETRTTPESLTFTYRTNKLIVNNSEDLVWQYSYDQSNWNNFSSSYLKNKNTFLFIPYNTDIFTSSSQTIYIKLSYMYNNVNYANIIEVKRVTNNVLLTVTSSEYVTFLYKGVNNVIINEDDTITISAAITGNFTPTSTNKIDWTVTPLLGIIENNMEINDTGTTLTVRKGDFQGKTFTFTAKADVDEDGTFDIMDSVVISSSYIENSSSRYISYVTSTVENSFTQNENGIVIGVNDEDILTGTPTINESILFDPNTNDTDILIVLIANIEINGTNIRGTNFIDNPTINWYKKGNNVALTNNRSQSNYFYPLTKLDLIGNDNELDSNEAISFYYFKSNV